MCTRAPANRETPPSPGWGGSPCWAATPPRLPSWEGSPPAPHTRPPGGTDSGKRFTAGTLTYQLRTGNTGEKRSLLTEKTRHNGYFISCNITREPTQNPRRAGWWAVTAAALPATCLDSLAGTLTALSGYQRWVSHLFLESWGCGCRS